MPLRFAACIAVELAWVFSGHGAILAQEQAPTEIVFSDPSCQASAALAAQPSRPRISISEVTFSGFLRLPVTDQDEVAVFVKQQEYPESVDRVLDEALERVRTGWQNRGYFKVQVNGDLKTLTSSGDEIHLALFAHVDEGRRYRLKDVGFKHANLSTTFLRSRIPLNDGDAFSRERIAEELENLRKVYGELGYVNFVAVAATILDEARGTISLVVELDPGKQFYVSDVNVSGLNESARLALLNDIPNSAGAIYNRRLWEPALLRRLSTFPDCGCTYRTQLRPDERSGTVGVTLDFGSCSTK